MATIDDADYGSPMTRWLKRIGIGVAALIALSALLLFDFVQSFKYSLPAYDGTVSVTALEAPVTILRDNYAIPHVQAGSFRDAAYGLGYAHAQDRLWQMEMARRFVSGRLSEMFGARALPTDTMMRTMGLYRAAEEAVERLTPESRAILFAYAEGVNGYLRAHKGRWPIEFVLAGVTPPQPWRPADSIAVLKGMAFQLSSNAFTEAARARLTAVLGRQSAQDFFAPFEAAPLPAYLDGIYNATRTGLIDGVPDATASDNWVVDGAHSSTGKPLLANDPHLGFDIPSVWYLAHLSYPDGDVVGGTLAGVPGIIAGRNRHVAWGLTNTSPDTQDLYLERLNPDNDGLYQVPGGQWVPFETRVETIRLRFGGERRITIRESRHGPVMSDAAGGSFAAAAPPGYAISLAWTQLQPDDTSFDALMALDQAQDAAAFQTGAEKYIGPMQNIVYADDAGHIGLVLPGRVPIRSAMNDSLGLVPAPGWDGRYDWQGYIPANAMFSIADPPSGTIATANNKTWADDYPYPLARAWDVLYRYDRIMALLNQTAPASVASFEAIQTDVVDTYALDLKSRLMKAAPFEGASAPLARLIETWDGAMQRDRPEPLIWAAWTQALAARIYADELGANFNNFWGYRPEFTLRVLDDVGGESRWCDDRATPAIEDCLSRIRLALADAAAELSRDHGADPATWRWGDAHKAIHQAQPFGQFPGIASLFNREIEVDGGSFTLLRTDYNMGGDRPYAARHGAAYRGIYDLAAPERSRYIISTGQSGNLFSPHYDDLMGLWAAGKFIEIPTSPDAVAASAIHRLTLEPASAQLPRQAQNNGKH